MNEKFKKLLPIIILVGVIVFWCLFSFVFSGCTTTRSVIAATDESIVSSQVSTARIEAINERIGDILREYDVYVRGASERAIAGNLDAERALDDYDAFVQGIIGSLRAIQRSISPGEAEEPHPDDSTVDAGNPFLY